MAFMAKRNFSFEQIPDLTGKTAIITGSNTGVSIYLLEKKKSFKLMASLP